MWESICMLDTKTDELIHFLFFFPSVVRLSLFLFAVGRLVWEEKDPEAETRAEGTEGRHLYACWQERERWSRKIRKFLSFKKVNGKTRKRSGAKIFALSPPYVWHFICLYVCCCVFFSSSDWKGRCKNENIFVKRWQAHHWKMCMLPHFPLCFSLLLWFILSSHHRNRH